MAEFYVKKYLLTSSNLIADFTVRENTKYLF